MIADAAREDNAKCALWRRPAAALACVLHPATASSCRVCDHRSGFRICFPSSVPNHQQAALSRRMLRFLPLLFSSTLPQVEQGRYRQRCRRPPEAARDAPHAAVRHIRLPLPQSCCSRRFAVWWCRSRRRHTGGLGGGTAAHRRGGAGVGGGAGSAAGTAAATTAVLFSSAAAAAGTSGPTTVPSAGGCC